MLYIFIIFFIFLIFIIIFLFFKNKYLECFNNNNVKNVSIDEYTKIMMDNNDQNIYRIGLSDNLPINSEDCFEKCDKENCIKMIEMNRILEKCVKCNSEKNKCFKKSIIGGVCNDCNETTDEKINCYDVKNFGCPNPKDINYDIGVKPYYTQINDDNINSPYDKKCVFCWNILDNI
jgi:hypothetical protein